MTTPAHQVIPAALAEYCEQERRRRLRVQRGDMKAFESVIEAHCTTKLNSNQTLRGIIRETIRNRVKQFGGNKVKAAKSLGVARVTVHENLKALACLIICLFALSSHAQRGTGANPAKTTTKFELSLPVTVSVAPSKLNYLYWNLPVGVSNSLVYWSTSRVDAVALFEKQAATNFANVQSVNGTNRFAVTNGLHYAVGYKLNNALSYAALYPSNRIGGDIWLVGYTTNMTQPTNIIKLMSYKGSTPPGNMRMWGIVDLTTGWE